jgi:hypothetical protein
MRLAHLIIAHKEPAQVERLVKRLSHPDCDIFIHVDKKTDQTDFAYLARQESVRFISDRQSIRWAGYSFTKAILVGMKEVLAAGRYDFINLLSGQDYPLQPMDTLVNFLEHKPGFNFMTYEADGSPWWQENRNRVEQYHSTDFQFKGQYLVQACVNRILPKRKFPFSYTLHGGNCAMYWTLSSACARYVVNFIDQHPALERFARYTWAPDEFLIPTLIMNSPFREKVHNDNRRYIDWSLGGANPKLLTIQDLDQLAHSGCFFARKFDIAKDSGILDKLDELLAQRQLKHAVYRSLGLAISSN